MVGFTYYGKSTATIISTPLLLTTMETGLTSSMSRSKIEGDSTISRPITNEYGTLYEPLSFSYALIKLDGEPFTSEEQIAVERWLTSPKLSSELRVTDCNNETYSYFGLFTATEWHRAGGGFAICNFTFQVNGAYPYRYYEEVAWNAARYEDEEHPDVMTSVVESGEFDFNCYSDELEEYVYPVIRAKAINMDYDSSFKLRNITEGSVDRNRYVQVTTRQTDIVTLDCQHCRAYTEYLYGGVYTEVNQLKFKDLNWEDVDNIYWPRLQPGANRFAIEGAVKLTISYYAPVKKVGGWMI